MSNFCCVEPPHETLNPLKHNGFAAIFAGFCLVWFLCFFSSECVAFLHATFVCGCVGLCSSHSIFPSCTMFAHGNGHGNSRHLNTKRSLSLSPSPLLHLFFGRAGFGGRTKINTFFFSVCMCRSVFVCVCDCAVLLLLLLVERRRIHPVVYMSSIWYAQSHRKAARFLGFIPGVFFLCVFVCPWCPWSSRCTCIYSIYSGTYCVCFV